MSTKSHTPEPIVQAVFSVCASTEDAAAIMAAVNRVADAEFAGEFQEYISADRRPQFF